MRKLVDLRLDGDTELGCRVILTIRDEDNFVHPAIEITGYLPPSPELGKELQNHWQVKYRNLGAPYRIKPKKITYDGSVNKRVQDCKQSAEKLQSHLTTWLDSESFRPINNCLREELSREETIRFLIRTQNQQLQKLPWHLWNFFERYRQAEVAFSPITFERPPQTIKTTGNRVNILAILGHSEGINIEADRLLLESLPDAEITFLVEKTRQEINEQLWAQSWDIIFFAGHSETEGDTGRIYINQQESLTLNELWYALRKAVESGLKIAIFNSCDGLGLAQQLHDVQIPQMIVMRELVPDQVAQEFLKSFLTAFAGGQSFYLAVREARERLQGMEGEFPCASWLPVIYQNLAEVPPSWHDLLISERAVSESITLPRHLKFRQHSLQKLLMASVMATCLVMGMRYFSLLQSLELHTFDKMMQLRPAEAEDPRLLLVKVTEKDIEYLKGQYPLHDNTMLQLLKKLKEYQPRVIGLNIYRDRPEGDGRADLVQYLQQNSESVIPLCTNSYKGNPAVLPPPGIPKLHLGFSDVFPDPGNVMRRQVLAINSQSTNRPALKSSPSPCPAFYSLSFQLAFRYLDARNIKVEFTPKNQLKIGSVIFKPLEPHTGFYHKVDTGGYQVMLNYRANFDKDGKHWVALQEILENQLDADFLKGKIMIIGMTDPTINKYFNTPYNQEIDGLRLHAQMVSQILSAVENKRPLLWFLPLWGDALSVLACCLLAGIVPFRLQIHLHQGLAIVSLVIIMSGIYFSFVLVNGLLLPLVPSILGLLATGGHMAYKK